MGVPVDQKRPSPRAAAARAIFWMAQATAHSSSWSFAFGCNPPCRITVIRVGARRGFPRTFFRKKVRGKPLRAPTLITVIRQGGLHPKAKLHEDEWAVACAIQNMALAAAARGLGLFWSTGTPMNHPLIAQHFECDDQARVMGFLYVGWPGDSDWPEGQRGDVKDKTRWWV